VDLTAGLGGRPAAHVVALTGDWLRALLTVLFVVSIVIGIRSGELTWPPWRLSENDRADLG